jgi:hypothetical protein
MPTRWQLRTGIIWDRELLREIVEGDFQPEGLYTESTFFQSEGLKKHNKIEWDERYAWD